MEKGRGYFLGRQQRCFAIEALKNEICSFSNLIYGDFLFRRSSRVSNFLYDHVASLFFPLSPIRYYCTLSYCQASF